MKLSERMREYRTMDSCDDTWLKDRADEVARLEAESAALKRENGHLAKVIDNVWAALNEASTTVQGARGQMLADALLQEQEDSK